MKQLQLTDYPVIKDYLDLADYEGYNSNFVTMMMWNHEYHIEYETHEHYLIMVHNYKGMRYFAMPFTSPEYYAEAVQRMRDYACSHHFPFMIEYSVPEFWDGLKEACPGEFIGEREPDQDDYVYERKALETLAGKKMQKRRNHYNNFVKDYPSHEYRPLSIDDDFDIIMNGLMTWEDDKEASETLTSEIYGILFLLSSKHLLDIRIGGIFIDGELKAFCIGSPLKHSTIQMHVEKADKNIRGLYPAICKEFLEHEFPGYEYVNREEDMGLDNLRAAKRRLHPCHMVEKRRIFLNSAHVRKAKEGEKDDIIALWLKCFDDEDETSAEFYFSHLYKPENTYVTRFHGKTIGALQIRPFDVKNHPDSFFILGVCVDPLYERQGLMRRMMEQVLEDYAGKTLFLQAYHPDIYTRFGFRTSHEAKRVKLRKSAYSARETSVTMTNHYAYVDDLYTRYTEKFDACARRNKADLLNTILPRCEAWGDTLRVFEQKGTPVGYMIAHEGEDRVDVSEFVYVDALDDILAVIAKTYDRPVTITCDLRTDITGKEEVITTMMANKPLDSDPNDRWISEFY